MTIRSTARRTSKAERLRLSETKVSLPPGYSETRSEGPVRGFKFFAMEGLRGGKEMHLQNTFRRLGLKTLVAIMALSGSALLAQKNKSAKTDKQTLPEAPAVIWREPADIATRDLFLGPGGEAMRPDLSHVTFIKQETGGHTTKYRVRDGRGMEWVAKLGNEAQSET